MKQLLLITIVLRTFASCSTTYFIHSEKKDEIIVQKEYVLLSELNLTPKERFILHWKTDLRSEYAHYDNRSGIFYYDSSFDYASIINTKKRRE